MAGKLANVFLNHQTQIVDFEHNKNKLRKATEESKKNKYGEFQEKLEVSSEIIGLVIGRGGQNIKDLQAKYNVHIYIDQNGQNDESSTRHITILGKVLADVEAAR